MKQKQPEKSNSRSRRGLIDPKSYGWVVAVAGGVSILAVNNFQYTFGVFLKPLINKFGWSRAAISACVTIRSVLSAILSPISGNLSDRYGPRKLVIVGVFFVGVSYLLASRVSSLWQFYLFLGLLTGLGSGFSFTPVVATATRWFGGRSGPANGIVMSGFGVAQIIVPPLATYLILQYGWEVCFVILGLASLGVGTTAWSFIKNPPPGMETTTQDKSAGKADVSKREEQAPVPANRSIREAMHTPALWMLTVIYMITAVCYQMVIIHIVAAAVDGGASLEAAAIILTLGGVTNTLGKLTVGALANKLGAKIALTLCLALQIPTLFFLATTSDLYHYYIICTVYSLGYSGVSPLMPTMAADLFGTKSVGATFGILNLGYAVGIATGPLLGGFVFDATGSYSAAFFFASAIVAIAILLCLFLKRPRNV